MSKSDLIIEQAYDLALNRRIGGIMPYNLYESSPRPKPRRKARKRTKAAKKKFKI
jgi:hypothetical protein